MRYITQDQILSLNINEILLKDDFVYEIDLLKIYLLDCQCIIFLVDITNNDSYHLLKKLISYIINFYPNELKICKLLLVLNKIDLENEKKIDDTDVGDFINDLNGDNCNNNDQKLRKEIIEKIEISVETKKNLNILWQKVYQCVNRQENKRIAINSIKERMAQININKKFSELISSDGIINIVLMGDSGVGKSNLLNMYFNHEFVGAFISTIGIDRKTKIIEYRNYIYSVNICDTAGQERFRSLPMRYYKNADGILILFDVTNEESFQNVERWVNDMKENEKFLTQKIYIIGNKIDIKERKVTYEEGEELAKNLGFDYYEMSCKINMNVFEVISRLIKDCAKKLKLNNSSVNNTTMLSDNSMKKRREQFCC